MPQFDDDRQQLVQARAAHEAARLALFRTTDQLARVETRLRELDRWSRSDGAASTASQRTALEKKQRELEQARDRQQGTLSQLSDALATAGRNFRDWTDPRQHANQLADDLPVLLFPLRLETRFKTIGTGELAQRQLWVRLYPDECLIDTFEETLSETELDSAAIFWREYFRAAGVEARERAAWRGLVASHGSGRATWIIQHFRPLNPLEPGDPAGDPTLPAKPSSLAASDVILVVSLTKDDATTAERGALATYWTAIWTADGSPAPQAAALTTLEGAVGAARAAQLVEAFAPYNLTEAPPATFTTATATPRVAFVILPSRDALDAKTRSWTQAARAHLLPERFVLLGYQGESEVLNEIGEPVQAPFAVSPDPAAGTASQFQFDAHGNLTVAGELRWMIDFDEAVRRGMGFRVTLTPQLARGFDRLLVVGLRLSAPGEAGQRELETLLTHHYFGRAGLALLPQGAATNNTEDGNSAYSREDEADASYDVVFKKRAEFAETDAPFEKRDGQWLAEALGVDTEWLKRVPHAGGVDQAEARAMNAALWPATLGYFMDTLMQPVFGDEAIERTRWFFTQFVSGRGTVPAIRIGRQPYGILPTTAFNAMGWISGRKAGARVEPGRTFDARAAVFDLWLVRLQAILQRLRSTWDAQDVAHVNARSRDPHQTLLDTVGLHPASVEFHQRFAETKDQVHNLARLWQIAISWETLPANELHDEALALLRTLGYEGAKPPLFDLFWKVGANRLDGPVIQDGALSETDPLRPITTNQHNYIEWLTEWARVSFDTIRVQDGFQNNVWPNALLYVLLRHALELGYHDAGVRVLDEAQLVDVDAKRRLRAEPHFFHIQDAEAANAPVSLAGKSRYELLYSPNAALTGDVTMTLADHVTRGLGVLGGTRYLAEQISALSALAHTPTARLERLLAEHLDCCAYRLDAWLIGLVNLQLSLMRQPRRVAAEGGTEKIEYRKGIHLGAYGWLENVRPTAQTLTPARLDAELETVFNAQVPEAKRTPLVSDDHNEGYIHAPSINHAITAAVLRNGYLAHATPSEPDLLKVNLSSERVRTALGFIEGIRNGQSLAALLGYQFERGLHDRYGFAECDRFIYPLRLVFPLYTNADDLPEGVTIEAVEARNVVNGLNLIRHIRNAPPADKTYPFGFPDTKLPAATDAQKAVIDAEADRLLDIHDAIADLAIAEGVHQVVMGNYDRAAAALDAYGQATFPPIPDVVQTPRSGIGLTHRVGLHFDASITAAVTDAPRVRVEPAMNQWAGSVLPPPARVGCTVTYLAAATGVEQTTVVTQASLGLEPLDLIYILRPDNLAARSELEDRVRSAVLRNGALAVRPDLLREISYATGALGDFSFVEVAAMVRSLRALLLHSRPLRSTDVALPTDARSKDAAGLELARTRVDFLPGALTAEKTSKLAPLQTQLSAALPPAGPITATILANIDDYVDDIVDACRELARYGLAQTGFGIFEEGRAAIFKLVIDQASAVAERWQDRIDQYDALIPTLAALTTEPERIELLTRLERLVSTTATDTTGKTSAQLLLLVDAKNQAFRARQAAFAGLKRTTTRTIAGLMTAFDALIPVTAFDVEPVTAEKAEKQIVALAQDIAQRTAQLIADVEKRVAAVQQKLASHDATSDADARVQLLTDAARVVFGDEFVPVPSFAPPLQQADEWANAYDNREQLLDYQKTTLGNPLPVDDWLCGVARVREKLHHVENLTILAEAFVRSVPELRPIQFPFAIDAPWMALEYPPASAATLERELLLYTAHYPVDFERNARQCGLLLDEWTEVIPAETETTGLAFHFDKPNAEPPQTMLLVTPADFTGAWRWSDLVGALHETLAMARLRAVEPQQLDQTPLSVFLPATILATTWQPVTIAANLGVVNNYVSRIP